MKSLCCILKVAWDCKECDWTSCRYHWRDSARKHHERASPDCPVTLAPVGRYTVDLLNGV